MDNSQSIASTFATAHFIKEIGRGKKGARSLSRDDAFQLYEAMLDGRVPDLELGGIMLAMRLKGESAEEIAGFIEAAEASFEPLQAPPGSYAPVVIPSYNGSRRMPNLTPLLAMLLAREGVPVLVHGVETDPGRVTTAEILAAMGVMPVTDRAQATAYWEARKPVFKTIDVLAPRMARLLGMRRRLGVRNSTHTLVKLIQPFAQPALRLTSYTHPEYFAMLNEYFSRYAAAGRGDVFLMRSTEGETVANAQRGRQIDWFHERQCTTLVETQLPADEQLPLPACDAQSTAAWIQAALANEHPLPSAIVEQVRHCLEVARKLRNA